MTKNWDVQLDVRGCIGRALIQLSHHALLPSVFSEQAGWQWGKNMVSGIPRAIRFQDKLS
jgi:hypothetical protein